MPLSFTFWERSLIYELSTSRESRYNPGTRASDLDWNVGGSGGCIWFCRWQTLAVRGKGKDRVESNYVSPGIRTMVRQCSMSIWGPGFTECAARCPRKSFKTEKEDQDEDLPNEHMLCHGKNASSFLSALILTQKSPPTLSANDDNHDMTTRPCMIAGRERERVFLVPRYLQRFEVLGRPWALCEDKATNERTYLLSSAISNRRYLEWIIMNKVEVKTNAPACGGAHLANQDQWYIFLASGSQRKKQ